MPSLITAFESCLEALAHGDRVKFYEAIAAMYLQMDYGGEPVPALVRRMVAAVESTSMPTPAEQEEYDATRTTEIAERRAKRFRREWKAAWELVGEDTLAEEFRLLIEESRGETRQEPVHRKKGER